ncbi:hypothetical protein LCGC14_1414370 [marine sediment metagenome]|uniref:Uncharacterized protein n=1 Tax=marine sediment metagenome TaxID=412755 RepID=A0A0F9JTL9_9ZZZZ
MPDRREKLIIGFALRFLFDNLDPEVEEALDDTLNDKEQPSLVGDSELEEMAKEYEES